MSQGSILISKNSPGLNRNPFDYTEPDLDIETVGSLLASRTADRNNFEGLVALNEEGVLLARLMEKTADRSYMSEVLGSTSQRAAIANMMSDLMNGTKFESGTIWYCGLALSWLVSYPIPENLEHLGECEESLRPLAELALGDNELLAKSRPHVKIASRHENSLSACGLTFEILCDDTPMRPVGLGTLAQSHAVHVPKDRNPFPAVVAKAGGKLSIRIKNTGEDTIEVTPSFCGMPLCCEDIVLDGSGFVRSTFPLSTVKPTHVTLEPGQEKILTGIETAKITIAENQNHYNSDIVGHSSRSEFSFLAENLYLRSLSDAQLGMLMGIQQTQPTFFGEIISQNATGWLKKWYNNSLNPPYTVRGKSVKKAPLYFNSGTSTNALSSSDLTNPHLGTISFIVVRQEQVPKPRKDRYEGGGYTGGVATMGATKGGGGGFGLSGGSAGIESIQTRTGTSAYGSSDYDIARRFMGYIPVSVVAEIE